ncbi:MAG: hypothetical protein GX945_03930 [Lentisphaerae bacterium]|jgi:hypothetical protein|nr:hypothetical protein [Lentisphaerota bacterium]
MREAGTSGGVRCVWSWSSRCCLAVLSLLLLVMTACESKRDELVFVLSLHELVSAGEVYDSLLFYPVTPAGEERQYLVRRFPIIDSRFFCRGEVVPDPDGIHAGLRLYIDRVGRRVWQQAAGIRGGDVVAVVMDGFYVGSSPLPASIDARGVCTIKALWTVAEAEKIVSHIESNYQILSSSP